MTTEEKLDLVMDVYDHFDFEKVHKVMCYLKWVWRQDEGPDRVPELHEVKKSARKAMMEAIERGSYNCGGWNVTYEDGVLELKFVLESWDSYSTRGN